MIQLSSLTKAFGENVLFDNVTWQISGRDRIGLCGPNGVGKTTLLRILAGQEEADAGTVIKPADLTVGYLPQDGLIHAGRTVLEEARTAFQPLLNLKAEMHELEARLADATMSAADHGSLPGTLQRSAARLPRFGRLRHRPEGAQGAPRTRLPPSRGRAPDRDLFRWLADADRPRQAVAEQAGTTAARRTDETTSISRPATGWKRFSWSIPHAVILVSHDRFFLDSVVTHIAEVGLRTLTTYRGSYSDYLIEREERLERRRELKRRQDEEIARIKTFVDRFRYQATKASQVQSRLKMLDKITPIEVPPELKRVHFSFPPCVKSGRLVLDLRDVRKAYAETVVFRGIDVHIERGDRAALIGPNGAGKSTLMRLLSDVDLPDAGVRVEGHHVVRQYFAQDEASRLDPSLTIYETLASGSPTHMVPAIRNILGGFLFSGDDVHKRVGVLSGGERTRLAVARLLLRPSNTLLLDEPTNHLDIDSTNILLDALTDFGGTLVFVSHDRYFVDRLATKIIEVGHGDAIVYPGTYEEFRWTKAQTQAAAASRLAAPDRHAVLRRKPPRAGSERRRRPIVTTAEARRKAQTAMRRRKREISVRVARIAQLEQEIADREQAIRELEASMAAPGFYKDREAARPLVDRHQTLMWEVGDLIQEWEEMQMTETDDAAPEV